MVAQPASKPRVRVRVATAHDIPKLVELNKVAYPTLSQENIIWGASHLRSHQKMFPEGQLVAVLEGRIVGAAATLLVDLGRDPLRSHTWAGTTPA